MARATYIYVIKGTLDSWLGMFTVKREMISSVTNGRFNRTGLRYFRFYDGHFDTGIEITDQIEEEIMWL